MSSGAHAGGLVSISVLLHGGLPIGTAQGLGPAWQDALRAALSSAEDCHALVEVTDATHLQGVTVNVCSQVRCGAVQCEVAPVPFQRACATK